MIYLTTYSQCKRPILQSSFKALAQWKSILNTFRTRDSQFLEADLDSLWEFYNELYIVVKNKNKLAFSTKEFIKLWDMAHIAQWFFFLSMCENVDTVSEDLENIVDGIIELLKKLTGKTHYQIGKVHEGDWDFLEVHGTF